MTPTDNKTDLRRRYTDEAVRYLPRLFQMADKNRYSPTYGSFDRSYWHYRTMDFPCGMYQEFCLPLALAATLDFPGNPWFGQERVRELALAGVDFSMRSAHRDGSCDDYFPFEKALGALVFSLYAATETCLILEEQHPEWLEFFSRRANYLMKHNESGQLTNHQALAALALYNVYMLTGDTKYLDGSNHYLSIVKEWFHPDEGWFQEYEGADPGYQTATIAFLAKLLQKSQDPQILEILNPAVDFCWHFMHPDGSYAGEYGSRNTYHFYAHGFEVMAPINPRAAQIVDHYLTESLPRGTRYFNDDDRMCAHYLYDWLQSWQDFSTQRAEVPLSKRQPVRKWFPKARMLVLITPEYHAVLNLGKGGVLKVFDSQGPLYSDTGLIGKTDQEKVIVSHLVDDYDIETDFENESYEVSGRMCERKSKLATPVTQILFRILNLTIGRISPDLLRSVLQKILITGKPRTPFRFKRRFEFYADGIRITSELERPLGVPGLRTLHVASDATSIYVANSNVYQQSVLLPWRDLSHMAQQVNETHRGTDTFDLAVREGN